MVSNGWNIWIDTGGTFTDCIGIDPDGVMHKAKVLSSSSLRGSVVKSLKANRYIIEQDWEAPSRFIEGFQLNLLGITHPKCLVTSFDAQNNTLEIDTYLEDLEEAERISFEVISPYEAPILGCRLLTKTAPDEDLPPMSIRLATTKGTNALLENKTAPTMLLINEGFGDLLIIGDQKRQDLFAKNVIKPDLLYNEVCELSCRISANGEILKDFQPGNQDEIITKFLKEPYAAFAVCLMNSYQNQTHEQELRKYLEDLGASFISVSSDLSPVIKILPRAQTTVVNASLSPVLKKYLDSVKSGIGRSSLHVMTSAGGLINADNFEPKDSLLSGPAGGVVGASSIGRNNGFQKVISFDMGGTSTDVARFDHDFDYVFEHKVGHAKLNAPALSIETVAAGGGSICSYDGNKLTVGPDSAGAYPGPACYGAGGPLSLTDINLLLGRLDEANFGIPIALEQSEVKFKQLLENIAETSGENPDRKEILEGFLQIANERMANAIRKVSMRKGYDPSEYALVGFGGAGAQHVCAIADELDINNILIPSHAGLLSAYGLGTSVIEQFAEKQVLENLSELESKLDSYFKSLTEEAKMALQEKEDVRQSQIHVRKELAFMRLKGQDSTIKIDYSENTDLKTAFKEAYKNRYGHWIEGSKIEVESIRAVASTRPSEDEFQLADYTQKNTGPVRTKPIQFHGQTLDTPVYIRNQVATGVRVEGPALILDPYSTIVIEPGWNASVKDDGTLLLSSSTNNELIRKQSQSQSVALELFTNRFTSIAEEMGEMLKRTARSVNVKERMDFSCALLNREGELVVNAPHIPVHLGALGLCIRRLSESISMQQGDVIVTNHPAYGGSHLPDVTVVTPIFSASKQLLGYAASRAHHAEIGGTRPGSMPPSARTLSEEGVVIPPMYLVRAGVPQWDSIRERLTNAIYPTRAIEENMADLQAAVAANHRGAESLRTLAERYGEDTVTSYMAAIKNEAAIKCRQMLKKIPDSTSDSLEYLDDGSTLKAVIKKEGEQLEIDFSGTEKNHPGNLNATPAIVNSVIMYVLRLLIDEPLPLNEGLLDPITIRLPECMLNPKFSEDPADCPAVVGGNTETSQRLVDLLLKPFNELACSQGTMNNVLFGNEQFGYYETIGGGTGAGPGFHGTDAVHHHMTNTAGTDPEILEHRYPVRLEKYAVRKESGGVGEYRGGNGIERELTFLESVSLSVLTQHRVEVPYGLKGGKPGAAGKQWVIRKDGSRLALSSISGEELEAGDRFIIQTPGGGGYGEKANGN
ncbi:5-oxoprolinase [Balneolaceae bacterium YR4-1]|uniref:5-oxoprolinase n=1 Tax=Halalkalibaculum roseum TaxID=2709311 RepID=A0A6M1T038_9BACT|nr:hydantoinase B/oxoprolinase family protein [Halalkalibaculum roseum]NGP78038.1 5-oxoprolinase [Halalkalibaculum roseum]